MSDVAVDVVAYGLAAGLSGSAFLASVILLATDRGVPNGLALLAGVSLVLAAAAATAVVVADFVVGAGGALIVTSLLKLGLGLLLLSLSWRVRPRSGAGAPLQAKLAAMNAKLQHQAPATAFRIGIGVAILPKRLVITLLAGAAIGVTDSSPGQAAALVGCYLLTATVLIWTPILVYVVGGQSARRGLGRAHDWVVENAGVLAFVLALLFGALFTGQAVVELLGYAWS